MADLKFYPEPNHQKQKHDDEQFLFYLIWGLIFIAFAFGCFGYMAIRKLAMAEQQEKALQEYRESEMIAPSAITE